MSGKPRHIPSKWGKLCLRPKLSPDVMIIMLFGPGVMVVDTANMSIAM